MQHSPYLGIPPRSEAEAKSEWLRQKMDPAAQRAEKIGLLEETARKLRKQAGVGGTNLGLRADAVEWAIEQIKPDHKGDNTMLSNTEILKARGYRLQDCGGGCEGHVKHIGQTWITLGHGDGEAIDDETRYFAASIDSPDGQMGGCENADLVLVIEAAERIALETVREAARGE